MTRCTIILLLAGVTRLSTLAAPAAAPANAPAMIAFDVETSGLSARHHRIIEIAAVTFDENHIATTRRWLIHPGQSIPAAATRVHGITDEDVRRAPSFPTVWREFTAFTRHATLIAHNARFDLRFIAAELSRHKLPAPDNPVLDTLPLARAWYPELDSHALSALAHHLEISPERHHRALDDARTLAQVVQHAWAQQGPDKCTLDALFQAAGGALHIKGAVALDRAVTEPTR